MLASAILDTEICNHSQCRGQEAKLQIAMIGLGRMGANMARRLMLNGHEVIGFDHNPQAAAALKEEGLIPATSLADITAKLTVPRVAWVMVPAGAPTEST